MDKNALAVLDAIMEYALNEEYTVIDKSDLLSKVDGIDLEALDKILDSLELHDMLVVKFSDADVYCVSPRPKGKLTYENDLRAKREEAERKRIAEEEAEKKRIAEAAAIAAGEEIAIREEQKPEITMVEETAEPMCETQSVTLPVVHEINFKKLAIICWTGSFIGGLVAAAIAFIIARLI